MDRGRVEPEKEIETELEKFNTKDLKKITEQEFREWLEKRKLKLKKQREAKLEVYMNQMGIDSKKMRGKEVYLKI